MTSSSRTHGRNTTTFRCNLTERWGDAARREQERVDWARKRGVPQELAQAYASLLDSYSLLDVVELAIERTAYPALRSWSESGPPRPNSIV